MKMRDTAIGAAIAIALGMIGTGFYRIGLERGSHQARLETGKSGNGTSVDGSADPGKKILYWRDPMSPGQRFDKPGKSPFMNMDLVPVYAGEEDGGSVAISPRVEQNLGVRIAEATRGILSPRVSVVGSVAYNERNLVMVQARSNGFLEKLYVRAPLDRVRKGQALAEVYVPDWVAAQEEYLSARRISSQTQVSGLQSLTDGARQRMRLAGMTDEQIAGLERTGSVQPRLTITAPITGVVAELAAREGMTVMSGAPLFRINGLESVWVNAEVPESMAARVRPGAPVRALTSAFPGTLFEGRVSAFLPEVNAATRTFKARIELANPGERLVPGMFARLELEPASTGDALLVPTESVIQTGTRSVVMVAQGNGKFMPVDVQTGIEAEGRTEVRSGLRAGDKVVVSGQFLIDSEASLKGTATRMSEPVGATGDSSHAAHGAAKGSQP